MAAALTDPERVAHHTMTDTGTKSPSFETAVPGTAKMTETGLASSFMERVLVVSKLQQANDYSAESALGTDFEDVECKLEPLARSKVQLPITGTRSKVERMLPRLGVVTEANVGRIADISLDGLARLIESEVVKTVEATYEGALQLSYFDSSNGLKTATFNVFKHAPAEVVRFGRGHTVREMKICRSIQSSLIAERIVCRVFSGSTSIVPMAEIVHNLVNRALDEDRQRQLDANSTLTAGTELSIERSWSGPGHKTRGHSQIPNRTRTIACVLTAVAQVVKNVGQVAINVSISRNGVRLRQVPQPLELSRRENWRITPP